MAEKPEEVTIVLIKNYWSGYLQSVAWLAALAACIGLAVWLESTAMQWVMAIFWFLSVIGWAMGERARKRMTPEDALREINGIIESRQSH